MKRLFYLYAVLVSVMFFVGCEKMEVDNVKPIIKVFSPNEDEIYKPGSEVYFEVEFSDNISLSSYKVNIHGAFDGHSHNSGTITRGLDAGDETAVFERTWLESEFISLGDEPVVGKQVATIKHHHIKIPKTVIVNLNGEMKEMPLREGHYHFIVYCTDESGLESFSSREIIISSN